MWRGGTVCRRPGGEVTGFPLAPEREQYPKPFAVSTVKSKWGLNGIRCSCKNNLTAVQTGGQQSGHASVHPVACGLAGRGYPLRRSRSAWPDIMYRLAAHLEGQGLALTCQLDQSLPGAFRSFK